MQLIGAPRRPEIDQYAIKFIIGAIAFSLPWIEIALTEGSITSISASFWWNAGPWPRNILVGFLFAIAAFLLAYNGLSEIEMWLAKIASLAALGIAMFPCECGVPGHEILRRVHGVSAAAMFAVLTAFCYIFMRRARAKGHRKAQWRAAIYSLCGVGMLVSIALFVIQAVTKREVLILWGETLGLVSFGISWLTASRMVPLVTEPSERQRLVVARPSRS
jgi:hypothetical protein